MSRALGSAVQAVSDLAAWFAVLCLGALPACILIDLALRKFGMSVVIGLEVLEYLLAASVVLSLPKLSMAGLHVTLAWHDGRDAAWRKMAQAAGAIVCFALASTFFVLAIAAFESGAMFRSGLEIPEAPVWVIAGLSFALAAIAEAIGLFARGS